MKNIKNIFKRPAKYGITAAEYRAIKEQIEEAYILAHGRQKSGSVEPSGFMKGLAAALSIIDTVQPHEV